MKKVKFTITYDSKILGILGSKTTEVHVGPLKNLENMKAGLNALGKDVSYDYVVIN